MIAALAGASAGALVAALVAVWSLRAPPEALLRTNVAGRRVPAVLGLPVLAGIAAGLAVSFALDRAGDQVLDAEGATAVALVAVVMFLAGSFDDRRGDERPRGFKGHLGALRGGGITGGVVKAVAGLGAGVGAGLLLATWPRSLAVALLVPLTANTLNLFDRAPGRAMKFATLVAAVVVVGGSTGAIVASAGAAGAGAAVFAFDVRARAMLGDAGANPLGAVLGLGLASLPGPGPWVAIVLLAGLNLASERWSFSAAIEANPVLRALDRWGRTDRG